MCSQVQGTEKIKICHDFYLIHSEEQIYDKGHYIVIFSTFFQFCGCNKEIHHPVINRSHQKTSLSRKAKKKTRHYDQIELDTSKES